MSAQPVRTALAGAHLASVAERLASARANPQERRRFRRLSLVVGGRMLNEAGRELECRTEDISPGDARIAAADPIKVGERVVIYLERIGRVSGKVVRQCTEQEYAIIFESSPHKREKLAETLTLLINPDRIAPQEHRAPSALLGNQRAQLDLEDGGTIEGTILDFSLTGLTFTTAQPRPPLGAWVRVGGVHGRVARYTETGFAVDFQSSPHPQG